MKDEKKKDMTKAKRSKSES